MDRNVTIIQNIVSSSAQVATPNVAVPLIASSQGCVAVTITALNNNAGVVYLGSKNVTVGTGVALMPNNPVTFNIADLSKFYIIAAVAGDGVSFNYYT